MNSVYWLRQTLDDVPASDFWLSAAEQQRLEALRIPKRRADWRLGRWTAKQAISVYLNLDAPHDHALSELEIRGAASGAPEAFTRDVRVDIALSLSHRDGVCICAAGPPHIQLGCDVETVEPHSAEFIIDYFDPNELEIIARAPNVDRILLVSLMWSAKESALKASKDGLRVDVRSVHVGLEDCVLLGGEWKTLHVTTQERVFGGWWKVDSHSVYTFVADEPVTPPIYLFASEKRPANAVGF